MVVRIRKVSLRDQYQMELIEAEKYVEIIKQLLSKIGKSKYVKLEINVVGNLRFSMKKGKEAEVKK